MPRLNAQSTKPKKRRRRRYAGVTPSKKGTFEVRVFRPGARMLFVGTWPSEREAAIVQDRVLLHFGERHRLNFPKLSPALGPLSPDDARGLARPALKKASSTSRYVGVVHRPDWDQWEIQVSVDGRTAKVGPFNTEHAAAIARDRIVLGWRTAQRFLNFPHAKLKPASVEEIRKETRALKKPRNRHGYVGISKYEKNQRRPWSASLHVDERTLMLGSWPTALAAAEARDRVARFYGARRLLNFPDRDDLTPADEHTVRSEAKRLRPKTSKYLGVCWGTARRGWLAQIRDPDGVVRNLGVFRTQKEAALVRDREALRLFGSQARLNFESDTRRRVTPR